MILIVIQHKYYLILALGYFLGGFGINGTTNLCFVIINEQFGE